jgi:hypothetical protein
VRSGRAWDLYDGQLFRVLKKAFRRHPGWREHLEVLIVSARYGVVRPGRVIETYDERLTGALLKERGDFWARSLRRAVLGKSFRAVHVNLGHSYLTALPPLADLFPGLPLDYARGGIGRRNSATLRWVIGQVKGEPDAR